MCNLNSEKMEAAAERADEQMASDRSNKAIADGDVEEMRKEIGE